MNATRGRLLPAAMGAAALLGMLSHADAANAPAEGAPTAQTLKLPSGPGSIRGLADDPSVSEFTGQASYRVPLKLPQTSRGFAPQISLDYHGELGNGPLGIGWQVGVAFMRRSTIEGVPHYDASDTLELAGVNGGGRLVRISAPTAPGEWRIEGQGNQVKVIEKTGGYEVYGPDGTVYSLGTKAASRQSGPLGTANWMADSIVDVGGQTISYTYEKADGQVYLTRIAWGPNDTYSVNFELDDRLDVVRSWRLGFMVKTAKRVESVRVDAVREDGVIEIQSRYELSYDETFALSRLSSVRMIGRGGLDPDGKNSMPVLSFSYAKSGKLLPVKLEVGDWRLDDFTALVDVDGDGAADLVQLKANSHKYRQNRGDGNFAAPVIITGPGTESSLQGENGARLADIEGRNRPNLIARVSNKWSPYRVNVVPATDGGLQKVSWSTVSTWDINTTDGVPFKGPAVVLTDINGDSRMDVVQWNGGGIFVRYGKDTGLTAPVFKGLIGGALLPDANMRWVDVNGDGISDIVYLASGGNMTVYFGHGDGTFEDFVHADQVPYPLGTSATSDLRFADLDRDGLLDIVWIDQAQARWFPGQANGSFSRPPIVLTRPANATSDSVVTIQDANGNGSEDIVWSSTGSTGGIWVLDLAGATTAGMLVSVQNGLGKLMDIVYTSTTALAGAVAGTDKAWNSNLPMSIPVVTHTDLTIGGNDAPRATDYLVRDGFWDVTEHRFGGFVGSTRTDRGGAGAPDLVTATTFHPGTGVSRVLRGRPVTVARTMVKSDGTKIDLDVTTNTWVARKIATLPANDLLRKAVLTQVRVDHKQSRPQSSPITTIDTRSYDGEGRLILDVNEGRTDLAGDEMRTELKWAQDETPWVRDLPAEEKVINADGSIAKWIQTFYGDSTHEAELFHTGKGWKRREMGWLGNTEANGEWLELTNTRYDSVGNVVFVRNAGVEREIDYDSTRLFVTEERLLTGKPEPLRWTFTSDRVLGVPTSITGPDGVTVVTDYDGLARPIADRRAGSLPHTQYRYYWSSDHPRTEVFLFDGSLDAVTAMPDPWVAGTKWRHHVYVANGAGETAYELVQLGAGRYSVRDWTERDARGRAVFHGDTVEVTSNDWLLPVRPGGMNGQTVRYDGVGRLVQQTLPTGDGKQLSYGAFRAITTTDGLAPITTEENGLNRVIVTRRENEVARTTYDALGRPRRYDLYAGGATTPSAWHAYEYDSLGRMVGLSGSDTGPRTYKYNNFGRTIEARNAAGQSITFAYDSAGRVTRRELDDGTVYKLHYDEPFAGSAQTLTAGRLSWIEEPSGRVELGYDTFGRTSYHKRVIGERQGVRKVAYSASGLPLRVQLDGAVDLDVEYDVAGRTVRLGNVWKTDVFDPAGRVVAESYGNGVRQTLVRDLLGNPARIDVFAPGGENLYGVTVTRNSWGAVTDAFDDDAHGLDESATFDYDTRGRLLGAVIGGPAADAHAFSYAYDDLQNLLSRTASADLGVLAGSYHYGEHGDGPRQLTSIVAQNGALLHTFDYDAAGRQIRQDDRNLDYDAADQLRSVTGGAGGDVRHVYGYDMRVRSTSAGWDKFFFDEQIAEENGVREYSVMLDSRVVAQITVPVAAATPSSSDGSSAAGSTLPSLDGRALGIALMLTLAGLLSVSAIVTARRRARYPLWIRSVAGTAVALVLHACGAGPAGTSSLTGAATVAQHIVYFHSGIAPGPVLFTDESGAVVEERRYEPFGEPIDRLGPSGAGPVDFKGLDIGPLNKPVDPSTGWSYHGARWFASETGRWITNDPAVLTPDAGFAMNPWTLHPYAYVENDPISYWDPDGHRKERFVPDDGDGRWVTVPDHRPRSREGVEVPLGGPGAKVVVLALEHAAEHHGLSKLATGITVVGTVGVAVYELFEVLESGYGKGVELSIHDGRTMGYWISYAGYVTGMSPQEIAGEFQRSTLQTSGPDHMFKDAFAEAYNEGLSEGWLGFEVEQRRATECSGYAADVIYDLQYNLWNTKAYKGLSHEAQVLRTASYLNDHYSLNFEDHDFEFGPDCEDWSDR